MADFGEAFSDEENLGLGNSNNNNSTTIGKLQESLNKWQYM